jgi:ABC-type Na+ efflux pump permease subunit
MALNLRKVRAIIRREYIEHIRRKAFWIFTILLPLMWIAFFAVSIFTQTRASGVRHIAVIDPTGKYFAPLHDEIAHGKDAARFELTNAPVPSASTRSARISKAIEARKLDGYHCSTRVDRRRKSDLSRRRFPTSPTRNASSAT